MDKNQALAHHFYQQIIRLQERDPSDQLGQMSGIYQLFDQIVQEITSHQGINFHTLFSRISFAAHHFKWTNELRYAAQVFRKKGLLEKADAASNPTETKALIELGILVAVNVVSSSVGVEIPESIASFVKDLPWPDRPEGQTQQHLPELRVFAIEDLPLSNELLAEDPQNPGIIIRIQYGMPDRNAHFDESIELIREVFGFPITLQLIDVVVRDEVFYEPRIIVIQPDHLIDVTAIAECFSAEYADPRTHILKKYLPQEVRSPLVIGNLVNWILDKLLSEEDMTWQQLKLEMFRTNPLGLSVLPEDQLIVMMQKLQAHYVHLVQVIMVQFPNLRIEPKHCLLEPSFLSASYGIQGRLDVFHFSPDRPQEAAIIELKSGSTYKVNQYGLNRNHYIQTMLYDLLIQSAFKGSVKPSNYILYSALEIDQLKFAPVLKTEQEEAINMRNRVLALEYQLGSIRSQSSFAESVIGSLNLASMPFLKGFQSRDVQAFEERMLRLNDIERAYFLAFAGFIAREQNIAKVGRQGFDTVNGQAALWLEDPLEKEQQFKILRHLELTEHSCDQVTPIVILKRPDGGSKLANFRVGDVVILYRSIKEQRPIEGQIHRSSIISINNERVELRLRAPQLHREVFDAPGLWNIEPDSVDSSFISLSRGLYGLILAPKAMRELLLTQRAPAIPQPTVPIQADKMTIQQQQVLSNMLAAPEYFLLWGPPGTGKTSVMLKEAIRWILDHTNERILLLAYTNRAVDEMCEAIESIGPNIRENYFRIGSRYGTDPGYREQLLDNKIEGISKRRDLIQLIENHRIIVGTIASVSGKPELFELLNFDRVIIDEASQILEPVLVGLLPKVKRFILIGDHRQLPAVVAQHPDQSKVEDPKLNKLGLKDMRDSLFERLYARCREEKWNWAYAQLEMQGRMHEDLMSFPSAAFYEGNLSILPAQENEEHFQKKALDIEGMIEENWKNKLLTQRNVFIPQIPQQSTHKTNLEEAAMVVDIIEFFKDKYEREGRQWNSQTLGVITPFRAQIAAIQHLVDTRGLKDLALTVDTVERYQGGARDIILMSLCANSPAHLRSIVSLSSDGIDRKLNVALTRGRNHMILIGNPEILNKNAVYQDWIVRYGISLDDK
ncbi:MAG: DEAD/DEAH box helicase [Saprospiraceae bacterium]